MIRRLCFFFFPLLFVAALYLLMKHHADEQVLLPKAIPDLKAAQEAPKTGFRQLKLEDMPPEMQRSARAREVARKMVKAEAFPEFHQWLHDYLHASLEKREGMMRRGQLLAEARRVALKEMIVSDPRMALQNAVPPVVRQELPLSLVQLLEERVNEKASLTVLGRLPADGQVQMQPYVREVRTADGGVYEAYVYGERAAQRSTAEMSVVGIAVDGVLALEERPVRVVQAGEIPNHPHNLTRQRRVRALDAQGFALDEQIITTAAPERAVVETCPVSGQSVPAKHDGPGFMLAAVEPEQPVVEAGGQFHYLCSGGHIRAFEDGILVKEGGNGGPMTITNLPAPTQSTGFKTHLLMRVAFADARRPLINEAEGHAMMKSVQDWLLSTSAGRMTFSSTISPTIILPRPENWYIARDLNGSANDVLQDARAAAKLIGFNPDAYDFDTVIYTGTPGSFGGQANLGGKGCWLKTNSINIAVHEYGHNFGLMHANSWTTLNGSIIGGGSHSEYGDNFDAMGYTSTLDAEFNAAFKNSLGWLPTPLVHEGGSGTYRIYAMDTAAQDSRLRYAIKMRKDASRDYWVDMRQKFSTHAGVQSGIFIHWSPWQASQSGTHLLDMQPYEMLGVNDAPLLLGQTFSDVEAELHITPITRYTTTPPSMDVVVNRGPFPGNQVPSVAISTSASTAAVNASITFTASAVDPNGDALSYSWDFGRDQNGTLFPGYTNAASVNYQWASPGIYQVRCVASDMKGGRASHAITVQIGTPSPAQVLVSGRVTLNGQPLQGVWVTNGAINIGSHVLRAARTDNQGNYTIPLNAGSYLMDAKMAGYTFSPAAVGLNSITVGSTAITGINFNATMQPFITLSAPDASATEGADMGSIRISRTGDTSSALVVTLFPARGTASLGADYQLTPSLAISGGYRTVSIPSGQSFLDLVVTPTADGYAESYETVTLEIVPSLDYTAANGSATVTLVDANSTLPLVSANVEDRDAMEGADTASFTLKRLGSTSAALDVKLTITGTAAAGVDYTGVSSTLTIPAGASSLTVPVTMLQDSLSEPMETLSIDIAIDAAYIRTNTVAEWRFALNLHDDDTPTVTLTATDTTASEAGTDTGVFTITRTGSTAESLLVRYGISGTALHGTDYARIPGEVTIPAGQSQATVVIVPVPDSIGEPAQTVTLTLRSDTAYITGSSTGTVTLMDDGDLPYVTVQTLAGPAVEGGSAGVFRISNSSSGSGNISVKYSLSGTATNGTDYSNLNGTLSVARNSFADITITPTQDSVTEDTESIILTLTADAAYSLALDASSMIYLQDDERPQVGIQALTPLQEANNQNLGFFIARTGSTTAALTVNYSVAGTMTAGLDYVTPTGSVTIPAGSSSTYLSLNLIGDTLAEGTETAIVTLTPGSAYTIGISGTATGYVTDQQAASLSQVVSFAAASSTAAENAGVFSIPVSLAAPATSAVSVQYNLTGGTALGSGIDYSTISGEVTFAIGESTRNISLPIINDTLDELDETILLSLSLPTNARTATPTVHTVTLTDDDAPVVVTVGFASPTSTVDEGAGAITLPVALSAPQTSAVTVNYNNAGGTATSGTDYTLSSGTLTFAPGETLKQLPLTLIDDAPIDAGETIILALSSPSGASLSQVNHTLTIADNDTITLSLAATDATASEPGTDTGSFTLSRAGPTVSAITVNLTRSGTATNGTDYSSISTTATLAAGSAQTLITVTPLDDTTREGSETVTLTLATGSGYVIGTQSTGTVTIQDDEPIVSITTSDSQADESGDTAAFTLSRADASTSAALTVNVSFSGNAVSGGDYQAISTPITIPAGSASVSVLVTPINDLVPEPTETLTCTLNAGQYSISALSSASVSITDDEPFVSIVATDNFARENGETAAFTLSRTGSLANSLAAHFTITGTATNGTDYTLVSSPQTFAMGQSSIVIPISTLNDSTLESYESILLTLNADPAYTLGSSNAATVTLQDDDVNNPPIIAVSTPTAANVALPSIAVGLSILTSVSDDGAGPITSTWSTVSSPASSTVTYDSTSTPSTGVKFSVIGTYTLRLTCSDGSVSSTYDQRIVVGSPITGLITSADIGTPANGSDAGSYTLSGDTVTLVGSGAGIKNNVNTDGCYFVRQGSTGSGLEVIVRCTSITGGVNGDGRAGIMVRNGTGAGEIMVFVGLTNDGRATWSSRSTVNGNASVSHTNSITAPRWLRIFRSGNNFGGFISTNGTTWTSIGTATLSNSNNNMLVGLAVTGAGTAAATATFTNVGLPLTENVGPTVDAGINKTGKRAIAVSITGTRSDDGFPLVPGSVSTHWEKFSGPGNVTFTDAGALATSCMASAAGTQILRLYANDGSVRSFDDMTLTTSQDVVSLITATGYEVGNESGPVEVAFEISRSNSTDRLYMPATTGGTVTPGVDFEDIGSTFIFFEGLTTDYGALYPILDAEVEGTETGSITILDGPGYIASPTANTANFSILDAPVVALTASVPTARESGLVPGQITATRSGSTTAALTVALTSSGTATSAVDYSALPSSITFPIGQSSLTLPVTPLADLFIEPDESIILTGTGTLDFAVSTPAAVTLRDAALITAASISHASEIGLSAGSLEISRTGLPDAALPITLAMSGSATAGSDYITPSITIPIGQSSVLVPITPLADSLAEGDELVTLSILPGADYTPSAPSAASLTLSDRHLGNWKTNHFGSDANNPLIAADDADPDRDGLANLLEYALGRLPLVPEPPQQGIQHDLYLGQQRLTLTRDSQATDVLLQIQRSPTLGAGTWNTSNLILDQNTSTLLQARDTTPLTARSFLRAVATPSL
jgi:Calx-beta domain/PKD domain